MPRLDAYDAASLASVRTLSLDDANIEQNVRTFIDAQEANDTAEDHRWSRLVHADLMDAGLL